ncbi:DUF6188 family protein [Glycomyces arizonensis]|uniref:DUF6188 family protein n=1 Tax=Glycomyces arizonensis TaxID=256035 RepID=UPI0012EC681A|nr:DUF6188 family protein [Glycomyces arizonensis]
MTKIELDGQTIARVSEQSPLILYTSGEWSVTVESALTFTDAGDATRCFEGDDPEAVAALGTLLQGLTFRASTVEDGSLHLAFTGGGELVAPPDPHYESWGVTGPAGQRIVCMPGGELAVWTAEEPPSRQ